MSGRADEWHEAMETASSTFQHSTSRCTLISTACQWTTPASCRSQSATFCRCRHIHWLILSHLQASVVGLKTPMIFLKA